MTDPAKTKADDSPALSEEEPIITSHQLALAGQTLAYTVTVGKLPLKDEQGLIAPTFCNFTWRRTHNDFDAIALAQHGRYVNCLA